MHLLGYALEAGRAMVIAINKWDGLNQDQKTLSSLRWIAALALFPMLRRILFLRCMVLAWAIFTHPFIKAYDSAMFDISTSRLTQILQDAVTAHQPPMVGGRRIKLRFAHLMVITHRLS